MKLLEEIELQPVKSLKGKHLLSLIDYTSDEVKQLVDLAIKMKIVTKESGSPKLLDGKTLAMIFEKNSTRTRVSFEVGMHQLGGKGMYMNARDLQIGRGETVHDTALVLSGYVDGIMIRANEHTMVEELAKYSKVPVINGLTDVSHPCQALADLETIAEVKGSFEGLKVAYIGDGNNVAHSLVAACAHVGMDSVIAAPVGYEPDPAIIAKVQQIAAANGATVTVTTDPVEAVKDADVIYSDVWTSMGQEEESAKRLKDFADYQINEALVAHAKPDYIFLHCLPAHREEEVTTGVIDNQEHSYIFHQAENRMHAQKAVLVSLLAD